MNLIVRWAAGAAAVSVMAAALGCGGIASNAGEFGPGSSNMTFEVRAAARIPEPGYHAMTSSRTGTTAFVGDRVILTKADVVSAVVVDDPGLPSTAVDITLSPTAARRFGEFTRAHIGEPIAMLINGRLMTAPIVRAEIWSGTLRVDARFSEVEARRVALGFRRAR